MLALILLAVEAFALAFKVGASKMLSLRYADIVIPTYAVGITGAILVTRLGVVAVDCCDACEYRGAFIFLSFMASNTVFGSFGSGFRRVLDMVQPSIG